MSITDTECTADPTFDVVGDGDLYVFHAGEVIEGTWFRSSQAAEYAFIDEEDEMVPIPSGAWYRAIVPEGRPVDLRSRSKGRQGAGPLPNEITCEL